MSHSPSSLDQEDIKKECNNTAYSYSLLMAQAIWLRRFDKSIKRKTIQEACGISTRTLRRYDALSQIPSVWKEKIGLDWPESIVPPWPTVDMPCFAENSPYQLGMEPSPLARKHTPRSSALCMPYSDGVVDWTVPPLPPSDIKRDASIARAEQELEMYLTKTSPPLKKFSDNVGICLSSD